MTTRALPPVGSMFGPYRIVSMLGRGGMGVVYRAEDERLRRNVALKLLSAKLGEDPGFRARFLRESQFAAATEHTGIVPVYDVGEVEGLLFIAMRYVEGRDLAALLREEGSLEPARAVALVRQLADALDAAHARGLVHRDVKPSNALVAQEHAGERVYLVDFGITQDTTTGERLTEAGQMVGTPDYLAPERIRGDEIDGRADVYSLGCVLFECLTGEVPFPRTSEMAAIYAHLEEPPPLVSDRRPGLPPGLDNAVGRALAKDPDHRWDSCGDLAAAAIAALSEQPPTVAVEPPPERSPGALVGRRAELAALVAGLDEAIEGQGRLFLLGGEPGIGKSRLAEEFVRAARATGARVLVARCWEPGGAPAFWPWVQAVRTYARDTDPAALRAQLGTGAAELAQVVPELRTELPGLPHPSSIESEDARFRLFDATAQFLHAAAEERPIVVVLEDLHAADTPSLLLLRYLARELGSSRLLVLGTYRDVDPVPERALSELLTELAREPVTRRLPLRGLTSTELAEYAELTAAKEVPTGLVAALHQQTDGNPLFAGEIVRLLCEEGDLPQATGHLQLAVPESVRGVIDRRLGHLSQECRRVLVLASVLGREFAPDTLARLAELPEEALLDLLDEATEARVVADSPSLHGGVRFAHALIHDVLYGRLTSARRVRVHHRVVEALEALYRDDPGPHLAELAHHAIAGRETDRGLRYASLAGDRALELLAYEEAARLYEIALDALALSAAPEATRRCELLLSLGEARSRAGETAEAKRALLDAAAVARQFGLAPELARAASEYGGRIVFARAGDDPFVLPLLEEALGALGDTDARLRIRLLSRLAGALRDEPSRDRRDALSAEATELARSVGDPAELAYALDGRAMVILAPDTVAEVVELGTELRDVAQRSGSTERRLNGHMHRVGPLVTLGRIDEAKGDLAIASALAEELGQPAHLWDVLAARAMMALGCGPLDEAQALADEAYAIGKRAQPEMITPVHVMQQLALCDFRGTVERVEEAIVGLAAERHARPVFRCALCLVHARLGRDEEARRALDELTAGGRTALPFDLEWLLAMSLLAEVTALLDHGPAVEALYEQLLPWAELNVVDPWEGMRGPVARYLGLLAAAAGRSEAAQRHFEAAVDAAARAGLRPWLAVTRADYARMLLAEGDRDRAASLLGAAHAEFDALGMEGCAARAPSLPADRATP